MMTKAQLIKALEGVPDESPIICDTVDGCGRYTDPDVEVTRVNEEIRRYTNADQLANFPIGTVVVIL